MKDEHIVQALDLALAEVYPSTSPDIRAGMATAYLSEVARTTGTPILEHTAPAAPAGVDWPALDHLNGDLARMIGRRN